MDCVSAIFDVHNIVNALGPEKSRALHVFHAFTGCDQTSAFGGRGKNTAWATWMAYDEVTQMFELLGKTPVEQDVLKAIGILERTLMKHERFYSHRRVDPCKAFPPHIMHYFNTPKE